VDLPEFIGVINDLWSKTKTCIACGVRL
jgi:hypothetical protein